MRRRTRSQLISFLLILGIVALIAQLAGVGAKRANPPAAPELLSLATLGGATVPDVGSTKIASTSVRAAADETVRMHGVANVTATRLADGASARVVCGIRYSRADDPAWTLGSPYETLTLDHVGATDQVEIERSFAAPAADRYSMDMACHVSAPDSGAEVSASGTMQALKGLPKGAATPAG